VRLVVDEAGEDFVKGGSSKNSGDVGRMGRARVVEGVDGMPALGGNAGFINVCEFVEALLVKGREGRCEGASKSSLSDTSLVVFEGLFVVESGTEAFVNLLGVAASKLLRSENEEDTSFLELARGEAAKSFFNTSLMAFLCALACALAFWLYEASTDGAEDGMTGRKMFFFFAISSLIVS
jgi:hypothetical protein